MFSQWARNPFKLCKSTENYNVVQNTEFGASGRRGFTTTNICYPTPKVSCTFSIYTIIIVSCNQLYCVQKKSFSHSSPRCIFLYSVHAGGDPSLFLPLASCAMSRNCKNGSTNQPGAVYVKTTAIWNKSPFPGTLWVLSVHWGKKYEP